LMIPLQIQTLRNTKDERFGNERARILHQLEALPGNQLVIVRYSDSHDATLEWVYNNADIDNSKVVWARDMGPAQNQELLRYYKDRRVWSLEPDSNPPRLGTFQDNWPEENSPDERDPNFTAGEVAKRSLRP